MINKQQQFTTQSNANRVQFEPVESMEINGINSNKIVNGAIDLQLVVINALF